MNLDTENQKFAKSLHKNKPAVAISALHNGAIYSDYSRPCDPLIIRHLIRKKLRNLKDESGTFSNLYCDNGVNIIGNCAEINVAALIYKEDQSIQLEDIEFSSAIRPRTKQPIKRCENCKKIFGD